MTDLWTSDPDAWRGVEHLADWPEECAGPEYRLTKRAGLPPDDSAPIA